MAFFADRIVGVGHDDAYVQGRRVQSAEYSLLTYVSPIREEGLRPLPTCCMWCLSLHKNSTTVSQENDLSIHAHQRLETPSNAFSALHCSQFRPRIRNPDFFLLVYIPIRHGIPSMTWKLRYGKRWFPQGLCEEHGVSHCAVIQHGHWTEETGRLCYGTRRRHGFYLRPWS
jgi:hypothetical protein